MFKRLASVYKGPEKAETLHYFKEKFNHTVIDFIKK